MNLQAALNVLRHGGSLTSPELGARLGVGPPTVSRLMDSLLAAGLVREDGLHSTDSVGRPPKKWALNREAGYAVGIGVWARHCEATLVDLTGTVVRTQRVPCPTPQTTSWLRRAVRDVSAKLTRDLDPSTVLGVGVALGGIVDPAAGIIRISSYMLTDDGARARDYPVRAHLQAHTPWPVQVANDANVGALACFRHLVSHSVLSPRGSLLYVLASESLWGLGLGLVIGGTLYSGARGGAGEVLYPHVPAEAPISPETAARAVRGDLRATEEVIQGLSPVLQYIASAAMILDVDAIVVGGYFAGVGGAVAEGFSRSIAECVRGPDYLSDIYTPWIGVDPLWPGTVELGAAGLILEDTFGPPVPGEPRGLVRRAIDAAAATS